MSAPSSGAGHHLGLIAIRARPWTVRLLGEGERRRTMERGRTCGRWREITSFHVGRDSARGTGLAAAFGSAAALSLSTLAAPAGASPNPPPFLSHFHTVTTVGSTVPPNGDVNPYGITTVPATLGHLVAGDTLVSNFNAPSNLQGTGNTIVQVSPSGQVSVFSHVHHNSLPGSCPGGVGLTTALAVLNSGDVVVGSLPVTDAGKGTPEAGCLIVLNSDGTPVETWSGNGINGPWDLAAVQFGDFAQLFVTNVLNGTVAAGGGDGRPGLGGPARRSRPVGPAPDSFRRDEDCHRVPRRAELVRTRAGSDRRRPFPRRDAVRGRHRRQPDRGRTRRAVPASPGDGGRDHPDLGRLSQQPARPDARPRRRRGDGQRWRPERGRDEPGRTSRSTRSSSIPSAAPGTCSA